MEILILISALISTMDSFHFAFFGLFIVCVVATGIWVFYYFVKCKYLWQWAKNVLSLLNSTGLLASFQILDCNTFSTRKTSKFTAIRKNEKPLGGIQNNSHFQTLCDIIFVLDSHCKFLSNFRNLKIEFIQPLTWWTLRILPEFSIPPSYKYHLFSLQKMLRWISLIRYSNYM